MAMDPDRERVYDPDLGGMRDVFPGEVVPPDQQGTMQRLMASDEEKYRRLYDLVAATGQLSEVELNGILKAGKIAAELARKEYLEAIRSNPANIIAAIFKKFDP